MLSTAKVTLYLVIGKRSAVVYRESGAIYTGQIAATEQVSSISQQPTTVRLHCRNAKAGSVELKVRGQNR